MIISNLPPLMKNKTCAITGHRQIPDGFDKEKLKADLIGIYEKGINLFLIGMATGFDSLCFNTLLDLKPDFPDIQLCAVIPCEGQSKYYKSQEKAEYEKFLSLADFVAKEERQYFRGCMLKRNDYMLDNSSLLYAYYNDTGKGGTLYTVNGAKKRGIPIIYY